MCASYGLGGGPHDLELTFDLPPMHEPESRELIAKWAREQRNTARITGRNARNLNPLIHAGFGAPRVDLAWWWIHIGGAPAKFAAFNARSDTLTTKWRDPLQRRAIIPAQWYIEKGQTFALPGDELFGIAAVVNPVPLPDGSTMLSYAMVTRDAVGAGASAVHPRMPLILARESHAEWLDPQRAGDAELVATVVIASEPLARTVTSIDATTAIG
ncbi:SOS response-associated peptidase family protein [Leucobacter luti]|uniref:Putative SOS response-associated peptidase YedK n=1 Tax=Leucobacter luti TaxID=340320 RepID=A0A4V3CX95_9MICO|nr:SOS response-associated peptidase family protein [Leucobacter luti]QYM76449.1 SOS response-associated peptidase [Leucobacter luti]TDP89298.1 putative SOS response-associated peptidase YedK [Leucobacter luti]